MTARLISADDVKRKGEGDQRDGKSIFGLEKNIENSYLDFVKNLLMRW